MFLTETAQRADVVLPAASTYEKDGTLTNTAGEVQMTHRSIDPQGPRSDFDLIRILSHQLSMLGVGSPIRLRTPEAAFDEIRQNVPATIFRSRACSPAARNFPLQRVKPSSRLTKFRPAWFSRPTIFCLRAVPWVVTVPNSNRRTRPKILRGVHRPTPSPGGIASQDRRPFVRIDDGACLPHVV